MNTQHEKEIALRNATEIGYSNDYFSARPQIDSNDRRNVFEAGFNRAWAHLQTQLADAQKWQPIETAPKDGSTIIVGFGMQSGFPVLIVFYNKLHKFWSHYGESKLGLEANATHWMPLRKIPAMQPKEQQK